MQRSDFSRPPRWPLKILRLIIKNDYLEEIEGDLEERFLDNNEKFGSRKARKLYSLDVMKLLRPALIKKLSGDIRLNQYGMFKHYLKVTLRNFGKHRSFSLINALGLAISLGCCVLIGIYLKHELSYDQHFENADRIYRVTREFINPDGSTSVHLGTLAPPFVPYMKEDLPELAAITRFSTFGTTFKVNEKYYTQNNVVLADKDLFKVFQFEFISGDPLSALEHPKSVVLTEQSAYKYFGTTDVLGKVFKFETEEPFTVKVTGIIKDIPENTHFKMEVILDFSFIEEQYKSREVLMNAWAENNYATYFLLKEESSIDALEAQFPKFLTDHIGENATDWTALHTQRLTDIHLYSDLDSELMENGNITHVYSFSIIGLLILTISIINYMNLTTAMSMNRAKEVGMRKVLGVGKKGIISQMMTEFIFMVLMAIVAAITLAVSALPFLRDFTGDTYTFRVTEIIQSLAFIIVTGIIIGLLAGSYPAVVTSGFKPLDALKSRLGSGSSSFRQALVVIQFSISSILILSTGVIFEQLEFMKNKNLGFEKENMLLLFIESESSSQEEAFKKSLLNHSSILSYGTSNRIPSTQLTSMSGVETEVNGEMIAPEAAIKNIRVDENFLKTYNIQLSAGRFFDKKRRTDTAGYILNEAAVRMIGWNSSEEAIDKRMDYGGKPGRIIGVVEDIHFESLKSKITPMIFLWAQEPLYVLSARLRGDNIKDAITYIEKQWESFFPGKPIEYQFLDERFNELYEAETRRARIFTILSCIAIFIAALGLFGLASFTVSKRTKEVGIRKVLGASIVQILLLLSKEFVILVAISFFIGFPIAYYITGQWLDGYAYRIDVGVLPFVITAIICLSLALLAVSFRTFGVAKNNPVDSLKYE